MSAVLAELDRALAQELEAQRSRERLVNAVFQALDAVHRVDDLGPTAFAAQRALARFANARGCLQVILDAARALAWDLRSANLDADDPRLRAGFVPLRADDAPLAVGSLASAPARIRAAVKSGDVERMRALCAEVQAEGEELRREVEREVVRIHPLVGELTSLLPTGAKRDESLEAAEQAYRELIERLEVPRP